MRPTLSSIVSSWLLAVLVVPAIAHAQAGETPKPSGPNAEPAPPTAPPAVAPVPGPSAPEPAAPSTAKPESPSAPVAMKGKWNPVFYGFAELDMLHDSTQSFQEPAGNGIIARDESFAGSHGRAQFGVRNSRFGVRMSAPEWEGIKASGQLEVDLLGNQPSNPPATPEAAFFNNPTLRIRHFILKIEDPYVDVLAGQYWVLFGWQSYFHPNTVQIQGVPGQIFSRTAQLRLSHTFKSDPVNVEIAVAAARPPQRDSEIPDGQAGLRVLVNPWKGVHTMGGAGTAADALGIGLSGVTRRFALPEFTASPKGRKGKNGWGFSADAMLPIVPATLEDRANALTLTGSFVIGSGIADLYTGLNGGLGAPTYPTGGTAPSPAPVDPGLVAFDASGGLHTIDWTSYIVGLQYYLPPSGKIWISGNVSRMTSKNVNQFVAQTPAGQGGVFTESLWADGNLFWDLTPAARFGFEYAFFQQMRGDGQKPQNHRVQLSTWFLF